METLKAIRAFAARALRNVYASPLTTALVSPLIGAQVFSWLGWHVQGISDADLWVTLMLVSASVAGAIAGDPHLGDAVRARVKQP